MNLNDLITSKLKLWQEIEPKVSNSKQIMDFVNTERHFLLELQMLMYKSLDKQYPCHGVSMAYDMFENYNFDIVVTPKIPKNKG